VKMGS
jgi:hypothetical protein